MTGISPWEFREHFPIFRERVHLCSCSSGAASHEALAAVSTFLDSWQSQGAPWEAWLAEVERARTAFAALIGASPHEVAIVPNASVGAYAVASSFDFGSGHNGIVTSDLEFPSVAQVWLGQQRRGASVAHVRHQHGIISTDAWLNAIDARTRLVSSHQVSYVNGARNDLGAISRAAHERGAYIFVDAYQGLGVVPIDVKALDLDFLVAGTLKYLLGTPGMAFLYVREDLASALQPSLTGWFARADPFAFDPFTLDFAADARRFQTGSPEVVAAYAANAGMRLIASVGVDGIWHHVEALAERLTRRLHSEGVPLLSPIDPSVRGPQVTFYAADAALVGLRLRERGYIASPRGGAVRVSLHYYNLRSDVDGVADHIVELLGSLATHG